MLWFSAWFNKGKSVCARNSDKISFWCCVGQQGEKESDLKEKLFYYLPEIEYHY
jgi:hypothetical protein